MSSSLKRAIEELAELAGVSPEALLKVAGLLSIAALLGPAKGTHAERGGQTRIIDALSTEPVLPLSDLQMVTRLSAGELRQTVGRLAEKGIVHTAEDPTWGTLVAIDSDGTFRLSELNEADRRRVIINWYANRHKNLSYKAVRDINRQILEQRAKRKPRIKDGIIEALRCGAKSRAQLLTLGFKEASLDWEIQRLLKKGVIRRAGRGLYELSGQAEK
jgi:hypothetical protein